MKKIIAIFAAAMLLLPLACNKKDDDKTVADLNKPVPTAEKAVKYTLDSPATPPNPDDEVFTEVTRTDDNTLVITAEQNGEKKCYSGACVEKSANEWSMQDGKDQFEVSVEKLKSMVTTHKITIKHNGKNYTVNALSNPPAASTPLLVGISRKFTIKQTTISVELPNNTKLAGAHSEDGCDLPKIAQYLKETGGLEFDYDFTGYVVKTIEFDSFGTILITFNGKPAYKGQFDVASNGEMSYALDVKDEDDNPIFNGEASGKITMDTTVGRVNFELTAFGQSKKEEEYKAKVQLLLIPVTK